MTLAHKVGPGLQDLQKRGQRILAERNAKKAKEKTWIGWMVMAKCYVTVGTFARRGLSSTAKTLRSLSGVRGSEY